MDDQLRLAVETTPTPSPSPTETVPIVDVPSLQVGDWLEELLGEPVAGIVRGLIEPASQIVLIVVMALVVSRVLRRLLNRAVEEMKEPPSSDRLSRVRRRIGLSEGEVSYSLRRVQRADALGALGRSVIGVVVWTFAALLILGVFNIQLGPLIAGAGVVGVALGFGAQSLVKDFLSGIFMLVEDQYGVGDIIDVGEAAGVVEGVGLRTTRLRDVTGTLWHVPNGEIRRVGNMSQEWSRALLDIGIAYAADIDRAAETILQVASDMAHEPDYEQVFLAEPEIWGVERLGDSSVDIRLVIKTKPGEQWAVSRELRRRIKYAFDDAHIEIPFPQRTVWVRREHEAPSPPTPPRDLSARSAASGKAAAEEGAHELTDGQTEPPTPLGGDQPREG